MAWCLAVLPVAGFNGHLVKDGGLELEIGEFPVPTVAGEAVAVPVVLRNRGMGAVEFELRLHGLVDEWRGVGEATVRVTVEKGAEVRHTFRIRAEAGVEPALYPVHVTALDGKSGLTLHAVRVFEAKIPKPVRSGDGILRVPENGVVSLVATEAEVDALISREKRTRGGRDGLEDVLVELGGGARVVLLAGPNGLFDGLIRVSMGGKAVRIRGVETDIEGVRIGGPRSSIRVMRLVRKRLFGGGLLLRHHCVDARGPFEFDLRAWAEGGALRLKANCPRRITRVPQGWPVGGEWKAVVLGQDGVAGEEMPVEVVEGMVALTTRVGDFAYRLSVRER